MAVPARSGLWQRPLGAFLGLLTAVFAVYLPSLGGKFLWDDTRLVAGNLLIRSPLFVGEAFRHTLFNDVSNFYRPTQTLVFIADYWLGGLDPFTYHLTSLLIHAGNAFLLCLVLRLVLPTLLEASLSEAGCQRLALGLALVWAIHPVHSAAVAYISGTADTLAMACCLTAVLLCEWTFRDGRPWARLLSGTGAFVAFLLGLCAKEIAFVWLVLFAGFLFCKRANTSPRQRWLVMGGATLALVAYFCLRQLPPSHPSPPPPPEMPPRLVLMLRALGDYSRLLLFPHKLFMERQVFAAPGLAHPPNAWFYHALLAGGMLTLLAFAAGAWWPGRGRVLRRTGAVWFLVGFLPVSNLFPLNASVAEHWLYLPSIGFWLFLAGVGLGGTASLHWNRRAITAGAVVAVLVLGALGARTWRRTFDWQDELTFFRQTLADGGEVPRARAGLAAAYAHQAIDGRQAEADTQAIAMLRDVVRQYPKVTASRVNLALALARRSEFAEAKSLLHGVALDLTATTENLDPHEVVSTLKGLDVLAKEDPAWPARRQGLVEHGLRQQPHAWELVRYEVQSRVQRGDLIGALGLARRFTEAHWWHQPAWITVGELEAKAGQTTAALVAWERAGRLDVHDAEAFSRAAELCLREARVDQALRFQSRAVDQQPASPRQHALLSEVLARQGNAVAARTEADLARALVGTTRQQP